MITVKHIKAEIVSPLNKHCFFGYFDKFQDDAKQQRILAHAINFEARQPRYGEVAEILVINNDKSHEVVAITKAWNWQQGAMLQWFSDDEIIFNDIEDFRFHAKILNLKTKEVRKICRPIYTVSNDKKWALSLNFSRLDRERPGYGYCGEEDFSMDYAYPDFDGIYLIDLEKNTSKLIISLAQIVKLFPRENITQTASWFNHLLFNPSGNRFGFFHRWRVWGENGLRKHMTHMFTANIDGSEIYPINLEDMSSHYSWYDDQKIMNFSNRYSDNWQYHIFYDREPKVETFCKDVFPGDGHCSCSPDKKWFLTDCYPQENSPYRKLFLCHLDSKKIYEIGAFKDDNSYLLSTRCDLHPRWSRDSKAIYIDSIDKGYRQIYKINMNDLKL